MSDNTPESNQDSGSATSSETKSFSDKYSDVMGKVNETLGKVDWTQMGKYGKAAGIIAVVVIAQIIICQRVHLPFQLLPFYDFHPYMYNMTFHQIL